MYSGSILGSNSNNNLEIFAGIDLDISNVPSWLPKGNFSRTQSDLIATSEGGQQVIFIDYFTNHELPSIQTENGLLLKGSLLDALAGPMAPGQYAQATGEGALSIGEVSSIKGVAKATRLDGNVFTLSNGDPIFKGDVIETEGSGSVGLVFLDKTTMSLSDGGKMVLDELVYDPSTGTGSMAVDMLEGAFSFVSGEIAKTGPDAMSVSTPVATIGIRGTTVAGKAAVEGSSNSFTLLQDAGGGVGQISVSNSAGTQTLSQVGATTSIASFNAAPPPPIILTAAQIQADYGSALAVLPPTPAVAPQPQPSPPPQEQQQEQQQEEEVSEDEETSEEEGVLEEGVAEEEGTEEEAQLAEEEGGESEDLLEEELISEDATLNEAFETAMADGATPEEAMAEVSEDAGLENLSNQQDSGIGSLDDNILSENLPGEPFGDATGESFSDTAEANLVSNSGPISSMSIAESGNFGYNNNLNTSITNFVSITAPISMSYGGEIGMSSSFGTSTSLNIGSNIVGIGGATYLDILSEIDSYSNTTSSNYTEVFYEDASLYESNSDTTTSTTYAEETSTSGTINGSGVSDTILGDNSGQKLVGLGGADTIIGGGGNDVIYGGEGSDILTGGLGDDQFYYGASTDSGDTITDFGNGNDSILIDYLPTHGTYTRSGFHESEYSAEIYSYVDTIPLVINFTYEFDNIPSGDYKSSIEVSKTINFSLSGSTSGYQTTYQAGGDINDYLIVTTDGEHSAVFLWEDSNHDLSFYYDDAELTLLAVMNDFNNENLNSDDVTFTSNT